MRLTALPRSAVACALAVSVAVLPALTPARAADGPPSFADMAARLLPGVVNVSTTQTLHQGGGAPDMQGTPFEQFFRDFMQRAHPGMPMPGPGDDGQNDGADPNGAAPDGTQTPGTRHLQSLGSGFIIDSSGIIVTNNHVIDGADSITVTLQDNTTLKARLLGHDDRTDLAVLKIVPPAGHPLTTVAWGNSDTARVGDWVLAIGDPFGLGGTVTAGIVSSLGRDINQGPYDDFIQTDAPINRGNSGGPLFNMQGQVIGINTAIYSPSGGSIGIGFSIPSNLARNVVAQLQSFGHPQRGWLGVRIQEVTPEIAESIGLANATGAMIAGINQGGPAEKAGLKPGDVILTFNGAPVPAMRNLPLVVAETPIGRRVAVDIWRDGHRQTLGVVVGEMPDDSVQTAAATAPPAPRPPSLDTTDLAGLGVTIAPIGAAARTRFQLPAGQKGVVVTDVRHGSAAADRGLVPGNIILEVQQQQVASVADVKARLAQARDQHRKSVLLLVQTPDGMRFLPLPTG